MFPRYAITFGEAAVLHVGGREIGTGRREQGFSVCELRKIASGIGAAATVVSVSAALPEHLQCDETEAAVLVIRDGAALISGDARAADDLFEEQQHVKYDRKFFD